MHSNYLHFKKEKKTHIKLFHRVFCTKYPAVTKETVQKDPKLFEAIKKLGV